MEARPLEFWDDDEWKAIVAGWPAKVKRAIGANLRTLQQGERPTSHCKTLQDFSIQLVELWHRDGQRVICTTAYAELTNRIHVLDAFMKDSRVGRKMRKSDSERIKSRVKALQRRMEEFKASATQTHPVRHRVH